MALDGVDIEITYWPKNKIKSTVLSHPIYIDFIVSLSKSHHLMSIIALIHHTNKRYVRIVCPNIFYIDMMRACCENANAWYKQNIIIVVHFSGNPSNVRNRNLYKDIDLFITINYYKGCNFGTLLHKFNIFLCQFRTRKYFSYHSVFVDNTFAINIV